MQATDQLVTRPSLTPTPVANLATPLSVHTAAVAPTPTTTQEGATTRATTKKRKLQTPPKADQQPTAPKASTPEVFRTSEIQGDIQLSLMSPDGRDIQEDDSNDETGEDEEDEVIEELSTISDIRVESDNFPPNRFNILNEELPSTPTSTNPNQQTTIARHTLPAIPVCDHCSKTHKQLEKHLDVDLKKWVYTHVDIDMFPQITCFCSYTNECDCPYNPDSKYFYEQVSKQSI